MFANDDLVLVDIKCKELNLDDDTTKEVKDLAIRYLKETCHKPRHRSVKSLLAACLYIVSIIKYDTDKGDRITQREIAAIFDISDHSIRKWYRKIAIALNLEKDLNVVLAKIKTSRLFEISSI